MHKVIYVVGASRSGTTSISRELRDQVPRLLIWEYRARLSEHVRGRSNRVITHDDPRACSTKMVTPEDVEVVDRALAAFVAKHRTTRHVLVDDDPVSKRDYGYRITTLSLDRLAHLKLDEIWVFSLGSSQARVPIVSDDGERVMAAEVMCKQTALEAAISATYGVSLGVPVYLFDIGVPTGELISCLKERLV